METVSVLAYGCPPFAIWDCDAGPITALMFMTYLRRLWQQTVLFWGYLVFLISWNLLQSLIFVSLSHARHTNRSLILFLSAILRAVLLLILDCNKL